MYIFKGKGKDPFTYAKEKFSVKRIKLGTVCLKNSRRIPVHDPTSQRLFKAARQTYYLSHVS